MNSERIEKIATYINYFNRYDVDINDEYYLLVKEYLESKLNFDIFSLNKIIKLVLKDENLNYLLVKEDNHVSFIKTLSCDNPILVKELKLYNDKKAK